jgi:hypothetical protein
MELTLVFRSLLQQALLWDDAFVLFAATPHNCAKNVDAHLVDANSGSKKV